MDLRSWILGVWLDGWFPTLTQVFPWSLSCAGIYKEIHLIGNQWTIGLMNPGNVRILKILVWLGFLRTDMEISYELSDELGPWELNGNSSELGFCRSNQLEDLLPILPATNCWWWPIWWINKGTNGPKIKTIQCAAPQKHHHGLDSLHLTGIYYYIFIFTASTYLSGIIWMLMDCEGFILCTDVND